MSHQLPTSTGSPSFDQSTNQHTSDLNQNQDQPIIEIPAEELISKDLEIKLSALSMSVKDLPEQINTYFYKSGVEIDQNRIISFQLIELSTYERVFNQLKAGLTKELIEGNKRTNLTHRLQFHDILSSELFSLISVSKFELINLCLIGFDMYVKPFDAILDIVNRISKLVIEVSKIQIRYQDITINGSIDKQKSISHGYSQFNVYKNLLLVSFYLQMLEEYLKKAQKVIDKKEKEIIFTGCLSFYDIILPILCSNSLHALLLQFTSLNYQLWNFNNGFDYFYLYQKLPIVQELEPIFYTIKRMVDKSLLSNTLTPFIFGILRHHASFMKFYQSIQSQVWVKYAEAAVIAILLAFKSLSLPFKEMVDLMNVVLECGRLSSSVYEALIQNINSPFGEQWVDIDQFFRSSLKAGYNSGGYALFHKLSDSQLQTAFKGFKYTGVLCIKQRIKDKLKEWIGMIQPNQQLRNKEYESILEKTIQQIDPNFSLFKIERPLQPKVIPSINIPNSQNSLVQIRNCLSILRLGSKDMLMNKHFLAYLEQMIVELDKLGVSTSQFNTYLLEDSLSKQSLTISHFNIIPSLELKQTTLEKFTSKILTQNIRNNAIPSVVNSLINIKSIPILYEKYNNQIEIVFFSEIYRMCLRYLEYTFEGIRLEDVNTLSKTMGYYFKTQDINRILQTKYRIKDDKLELISKRPRNMKVHTIKTLDGTLEIDSPLADLTPNSKRFILCLISLIVQNPKNTQYMYLLIQLVQKYPIINYFVLSTTVASVALKSLVNADIPDYLNFSNFIIKQIVINDRALVLIKALMSNGIFVCFNQKNLLKDFINVNIVDTLVKDIVKLSKNINKEILIKLVESLYEIIKEPTIIDRKFYKQIVPPTLCVLRTLVRISDTEGIKLTKLFDNFVRLSLRGNYDKMLKEIEIDHLRVNSNSNSNISTSHSQTLQFPALEIVILYQDQGILESGELQREKEQILSYNQVIIDPSSLKIQVAQQTQTPISEYSIIDASSNFIVSPVIQDIIGDTPIVKLESQIVEKYYTSIYLYPQFTPSQLNATVREFFLNSSDIEPCLINTSNSFRIVLLSLSILLEQHNKNSQLQQCQPFKSILKDVTNTEQLTHKCMYLIEKAGYMKFLNQPINNLSNIPNEYSSIKSIIPSNQPIIFVLLRMILSNKELIQTGFIKRYPSLEIRNRCHEIFYNIKVTPEIVNLILCGLSELGVQNLSYFIHSNPESLREYLEVATQHISSSNIHSNILNYHELFKLTKSPLSDPEFLQKFTDFVLNIQFYLKVLNERITLMIEETKSSLYYKHKNGKQIDVILNQYNLQKQNYFLNILSYLQEFTTKSNIEDLLKRHSNLFKDLITNNVDNQILSKLQVIPLFKLICSKFVDDAIVLPTFIHHNRYNSRILQAQQFKLPSLIQNWEYTVFGEDFVAHTNVEIQNVSTLTINYQDIANIQSTRNTSYNIIKDYKEQNDAQLIQQHIQAMASRNLIRTGNQLLLLESTKSQQELNLFKILGFICANMVIKNKQLPFQLSDQLKCFLSLNKLPWRLVESRNKKISDEIMTALNETISINQVGLRFQYKIGDEIVQLTPNGSEKLVTNANKREYCGLLAMLEFNPILPQINQFVNGFYKIYTPGAVLPNI